ncbi:hypothetical protein [Haloprofundus salilacus]|uniref:hypothetical protein n=1 Tax=Haloprofundus salilacus TaxID=2876190 RepID=UPI001CC9921F|nr:hypothetical protein [Haloprofundus salilacus]
MRRVSQREVLDHWLACEGVAPSDRSEELRHPRDSDALDRLLRLNPGAAAFLWRDAPIRWYHTVLSPEQLSRLRVVEGPEGMLWSALSPDGTVGGAARRVVAEGAPRLGDETGVDVVRIRRLAAQIAAAVEGENGLEGSTVDEKIDDETAAARTESTLDGFPDLVCVRRRPWQRPFVADGNHRAVAAAVAGARGAAPRVGAYLGVGRNRPVEDVRRAASAVRWAVRRRLLGESEPNGF